MSYAWVKTSDLMPPDETPVLTVFNGEHRILELCWDRPGWEDTYRAFRYWNDPTDCGEVIEHLSEVTHWMHLMPLPEGVSNGED